jgi:hypothetical protein
MCRWCHKPCGEREFCDEVCFELHAEAWEEYQRWSAALPDEPDPPQNEWCGSKGNNF